jgi:hypothetical protein
MYKEGAHEHPFGRDVHQYGRETPVRCAGVFPLITLINDYLKYIVRLMITTNYFLTKSMHMWLSVSSGIMNK